MEFKIIVKRSELTKAENLAKSGKLRVIDFPTREDFWDNCYLLVDGNNAYLWPTKFGYYGITDGWHLPNDPVVLMEKAAEIATSGIEKYQTTIEIDETR